ncbi:hypothetical protein CEXT_66381 [Caerostris extrusa]|uniref:Uncharacterized protein n=1 Tax=Caerostris extrusa TaxID=172846 RepID=A0AAV4WFH1_CAEEX|nr:hypothetical protein CEXT_66381 [Caerostris extrusa]
MFLLIGTLAAKYLFVNWLMMYLSADGCILILPQQRKAIFWVHRVQPVEITLGAGQHPRPQSQRSGQAKLTSQMKVTISVSSAEFSRVAQKEDWNPSITTDLPICLNQYILFTLGIKMKCVLETFFTWASLEWLCALIDLHLYLRKIRAGLSHNLCLRNSKSQIEVVRKISIFYEFRFEMPYLRNEKNTNLDRIDKS